MQIKKYCMATISSHIIVKNEIDNLPLLVNDLRQFSDEIIIVDTGSTDGTLEWLKDNEDCMNLNGSIILLRPEILLYQKLPKNGHFGVMLMIEFQKI